MASVGQKPGLHDGRAAEKRRVSLMELIREMFAPPAKQDKVQNIRKGRYQSALKALLD